MQVSIDVALRQAYVVLATVQGVGDLVAAVVTVGKTHVPAAVGVVRNAEVAVEVRPVRGARQGALYLSGNAKVIKAAVEGVADNVVGTVAGDVAVRRDTERSAALTEDA